MTTDKKFPRLDIEPGDEGRYWWKFIGNNEKTRMASTQNFSTRYEAAEDFVTVSQEIEEYMGVNKGLIRTVINKLFP